MSARNSLLVGTESWKIAGADQAISVGFVSPFNLNSAYQDPGSRRLSF